MPGRPPLVGRGERPAEPRPPARGCDGCDLCCRVYEIEELAKPMGRACAHLQDQRCGIYGSRPPTCQAFRCFWLSRLDLGPEWRPSFAGFVLRLEADRRTLWVDVDPERPRAWHAYPYYEQLKRWSQTVRTGDGVVLVHDEGGVWVIFPERDLLLPEAPRGALFEAGYRPGPHGPQPWARVVEDRAEEAAA